MHSDPVVEATIQTLVRDHAAHTILLYGSRANATHTSDSDHDIAAFAAVTQVERVTDLAGAGKDQRGH